MSMTEPYPVVRLDRVRTALQVTWNVSSITWPKPNLNEAICTLHGIETAAV
jgi:hypothetical protein